MKNVIQIEKSTDIIRRQSQNLKIAELDIRQDGEFIKDAAIPYFKDIFKDLTTRCIGVCNETEQKVIDKVTFIEYCKLPGILADRFYNIIPNKLNGFIQQKDFVETFIKVFISDFESKMNLTYKIYDFQNQNILNQQDIRIVLSYIPFQKYDTENLSPHKRQKRNQLQKDQIQNQFALILNKQEGQYSNEDGKDKDLVDRIASMSEIDKFLQKVFENKNYLTFEEYMKFNQQVSSEMFYSIMSILYKKLPCSANFFRIKGLYRKQNKRSSPNKNYSKSPVRKIAKPNYISSISSDKYSSGNSTTISQNCDIKSLQLQLQSYNDTSHLINQQKKSKIQLSQFKKNKQIRETSPTEMMKALRIQNTDQDQSYLNSSSDSQLEKKEIQDLKVQEDDQIDNFGFEISTQIKFLSSECYLKTQSDSFKSFWLTLFGNELYIFRKKDDQLHQFMHSLTGTFIKDISDTEIYQDRVLYPINLILPHNRRRQLFFTTQEKMLKWKESLKEIIGYTNIHDYYQITKSLDSGQYGQINMAVHKQSNQEVAIKIVKKKNMRDIEIDQQRREIEVLKMCQHPNIIKMVDLFENADNYYIILEYMKGKDLFEYLQKRNFKMKEKRVKEIIRQIINGIEYLHGYGIVHRDLKLENILMTDKSEEAVPKLADFGLSKIIGPFEKAIEPFGTLGYVAPEVLNKNPYSFSCDLWSLGAISYTLLCGYLPFDHQNKKQVAFMTVNQEVHFHSDSWKFISDSAKHFVYNLLIKDPLQRMTIQQALNHIWLKD